MSNESPRIIELMIDIFKETLGNRPGKPYWVEWTQYNAMIVYGPSPQFDYIEK